MEAAMLRDGQYALLSTCQTDSVTRSNRNVFGKIEKLNKRSYIQ